jgi:hypothetical protein
MGCSGTERLDTKSAIPFFTPENCEVIKKKILVEQYFLGESKTFKTVKNFYC